MVQWEHHEPLGVLLQLETGKGFPHHVSNPVLTHPYLPPESLKIVSITCPSLSQGWAAELLLFFAAAKSYQQELTSAWRFGQCPVSEQWHRRKALACVTSSPGSCPRVCCSSEPWLMTEGQQGDTQKRFALWTLQVCCSSHSRRVLLLTFPCPAGMMLPSEDKQAPALPPSHLQVSDKRHRNVQHCQQWSNLRHFPTQPGRNYLEVTIASHEERDMNSLLLCSLVSRDKAWRF